MSPLRRKDWLSEVVQEVVEAKLEAVDDYLEEMIEPIGDIGNPEKLISKPYEQWTGLDLQLLGQVYGPEPNPLSELIFRKEYESLKKMEEE